MTSTSNSKQRIFSPSENGLINISIQHLGSLRVGEVLRLQGPYISFETFEAAVHCLQRRHPFLRSRLKNNPAEANTYLFEEDTTLRLKIREIPRKRDEHLDFWKQEWREREKDIPVIGEGLVGFWLLQDPDDRENDDGQREIVVICEHSIGDGISISTLAHELLLSLDEENKSMFEQSLDWPMTMEKAIKGSLSRWDRVATFSKFIANGLYKYVTVGRRIARVPFAKVDFALDDMAEYNHSDFFCESLTKEETQKLFENCHREGVTVTSAISSAILCAVSTLVDNKSGNLVYAIAADVRRRYIPPMPNYLLSCQIAAVDPFSMAVSDVPTMPQDTWKLAKIVGEHIKTSINAGRIFGAGMIMGKVYERSLGPVNLSGCPTCGISNWGLLSFQERYGKWKLTGMTYFGNVVRLPMPMAVVYTVNGVLSIAYSMPIPIFSSSTLEKLHNGTMENVRQLLTD